MTLRRHTVLGVALVGMLAAVACGSTTPASTSSSGATPSATANLTCKTSAVANSGAAAAPSGSPAPTSASPIPTGTPTSNVSLSEDGSSLLYPYMLALAPAFNKVDPTITLSPASGGSGKGQTDAIAGNVQMGGSDAFLSSSQISANAGIMNIPIAVSAQAVNYDVPGLTLPTGQTGLHLSGCILANIYMGSITNWDDASIAALNPGATLPNLPIVPIHRVEFLGRHLHLHLLPQRHRQRLGQRAELRHPGQLADGEPGERQRQPGHGLDLRRQPRLRRLHRGERGVAGTERRPR